MSIIDYDDTLSDIENAKKQKADRRNCIVKNFAVTYIIFAFVVIALAVIFT